MQLNTWYKKNGRIIDILIYFCMYKQLITDLHIFGHFNNSQGIPLKEVSKNDHFCAKY